MAPLRLPGMRLVVWLLGCCGSLRVAALNVRRTADTSTTTSSLPWPSLTTAPPWLVRQYKMPAESGTEWFIKQRQWRQGSLDPTDARASQLRDLSADDTPDTAFSLDLSYYRQHDESSFWRAVCNGTNRSLFKTDPFPLEAWRVANGTECAPSDYVDEDLYVTEPEAYKACGASCGAILDVGCSRTHFRLCKVGAVEEKSAQDSCLRLRVPDHQPPGGEPSPPIHPQFWEQLCDEQEAASRRFRVLFKHRVCAAGKVLDGGGAEAIPRTPARCAELAAEDSTCSQIFDMVEGETPVCRCLEKGAECNAPVPAGDEGVDVLKNVYIRD